MMGTLHVVNFPHSLTICGECLLPSQSSIPALFSQQERGSLLDLLNQFDSTSPYLFSDIYMLKCILNDKTDEPTLLCTLGLLLCPFTSQ